MRYFYGEFLLSLDAVLSFAQVPLYNSNPEYPIIKRYILSYIFGRVMFLLKCKFVYKLIERSVSTAILFALGD